MAYCFPKKRRLLTSGEFEQVFSRKQVLRNRLFTLNFVPNELLFDRIGLVTSRKLGNAVVRNRCRRRIRELFRQSLILHKHFDIVVVVHNSEMGRVPAEELKLIWHQMWERMHR